MSLAFIVAGKRVVKVVKVVKVKAKAKCAKGVSQPIPTPVRAAACTPKHDVPGETSKEDVQRNASEVQTPLARSSSPPWPEDLPDNQLGLEVRTPDFRADVKEVDGKHAAGSRDDDAQTIAPSALNTPEPVEVPPAELGEAELGGKEEHGKEGHGQDAWRSGSDQHTWGQEPNWEGHNSWLGQVVGWVMVGSPGTMVATWLVQRAAARRNATRNPTRWLEKIVEL